MILTLAVFAQLAASCGPSVHVETLAAVARAESRFNTLAIGDNSLGRSRSFTTPQAAVATATALIRQGHSVDLGLMQINSKNLRGLGMSVADTFDACRSIAAGARVLSGAYRQPNVGEDAQPALLRAISRYNTGNPTRGFANGYVGRVLLAAAQVVPALRLGGAPAVVAGPDEKEDAATPPPPALPPAPPSWDVYGSARYKREYGGAIDIARAAAPSGNPAPASALASGPVERGSEPGAPVQLRAMGGDDDAP